MQDKYKNKLENNKSERICGVNFKIRRWTSLLWLSLPHLWDLPQDCYCGHKQMQTHRPQINYYCTAETSLELQRLSISKLMPAWLNASPVLLWILQGPKSHSDLFKTTSNWLPIPIHLTSGIWKLAPDTSYRLQMLTKDLLQPIQAANPLKPWMPRARHPLPPTQFSQTTFPERWRDIECQL